MSSQNQQDKYKKNMEKINKPKLVLFQYKCHENLPKFVALHRYQHIKCLAQFFDVDVINNDCNFQQICDLHHPDLALFESGVNYKGCQRIEIANARTNSSMPKLGLHNGDSWCEARAGFISDMELWGIENYFSICTTMAEHTPEIADNLYVWPNFIDPDIYHDYHLNKNIPFLITGRQHSLYLWREQINHIITQSYPSLICPHVGYDDQHLTSRMMYGEEYARSINASWFVPTCGSIEQEVVRKHFEIPSCKSCLITEKTASLEAAGFVDMQNCIFTDGNDLLDKLDYLFEHQDELNRITTAGYDLVHSRHTLKERNQVFQWFNLHEKIKSNQKIIQTNPFDSLSLAESSSNLNYSINSNGLVTKLLREGDEYLWSRKYKEAESLYYKCFNYISWMPEPKLRLSLCNLCQGNAEKAISWIMQPLKYTLEDYKAIDPDPLEWAYFIICLLCQGNLVEAIIRINQFKHLSHPELDRLDWVIHSLCNQKKILPWPEKKSLNIRATVHHFPEISFMDWIENLHSYLQACQQFRLAEDLMNCMSTESQKAAIKKEKITQKLNRFMFKIRVKYLNFILQNLFKKSFMLSPISEASYFRISVTHIKKRKIKTLFSNN